MEEKNKTQIFRKVFSEIFLICLAISIFQVSFFIITIIFSINLGFVDYSLRFGIVIVFLIISFGVFYIHHYKRHKSLTSIDGSNSNDRNTNESWRLFNRSLILPLAYSQSEMIIIFSPEKDTNILLIHLLSLLVILLGVFLTIFFGLKARKLKLGKELNEV